MEFFKVWLGYEYYPIEISLKHELKMSNYPILFN